MMNEQRRVYANVCVTHTHAMQINLLGWKSSDNRLSNQGVMRERLSYETLERLSSTREHN